MTLIRKQNGELGLKGLLKTIHDTDNRIVAFRWRTYWRREQIGPDPKKKIAYERTIYPYKISYTHWANSPRLKSR